MIDKPEFYTLPPVIDYNKMMDYIDEKYNLDNRDYGGRYKNKKYDDSIPYLDFWHYLLENHFNNISNGCIETLGVLDLLVDEHPDWVKEIAQLIYNEYEMEEMNCYVAW